MADLTVDEVRDDLRAERFQRARMALFDIGLDPELLDRKPDGTTWIDAAVTSDTAWRLNEVTLMGQRICLACHTASREVWRLHGDYALWLERREACVAARRFEPDCGVSR